MSTQSNKPDQDENSDVVVLKLASKLCLTVFLHPTEYAKTLMQLGHEPIAPVPTKTLLGKPALALPSVLRYIGFIRKRDGFFGLYAGLTPRLLEMGARTATVDHFEQYWPKKQETEPLGASGNDQKDQERLVYEIQRGCALGAACAVVTQPFHVIAVRIMAQFVGGEKKYSEGPLAPIREIINESGIVGFWSGLIPRLVSEFILVTLSGGLTFAINRFLLKKEKEMMKYTSMVSEIIAASFIYPFKVVETCMIVNRSGLSAGYPPHMPFYQNWVDCYKHLRSNHQLKRGNSPFFRYYTGPQVIVGDRVLPVNQSMFRVSQ